MTTLQAVERDGVQVGVESGGWCMLWRPAPGWEAKSPAELLELTATLPGNLRCAIGPGGAVEILGEVPGDALIGSGDDRLLRLLRAPCEEADTPMAEYLESVLDGLSLNWTRREATWVIPVTEGMPRELRLHAVPGGVRVEAGLLEWDEIGGVAKDALSWLLAAAQADLRFSRAELDEHGVRLASRAETEYLETDLPHSVQAVAAGCRLLEREVRALLVPELAQAYVNFHRRITASP